MPKDKRPIQVGSPENISKPEKKVRGSKDFGTSKAGLGSQKLEMVDARRDQVMVGKEKPSIP